MAKLSAYTFLNVAATLDGLAIRDLWDGDDAITVEQGVDVGGRQGPEPPQAVALGARRALHPEAEAAGAGRWSSPMPGRRRRPPWPRRRAAAEESARLAGP